MKPPAQSSGYRAIQIVGVVIGLYLATLVGVAYVGQARFHDALVEQERLSIEKHASTIDFFLATQQAAIDELAQSRTVHTFLANRDLGMSMRYGLRASLSAISRDFRHTLDTKKLSETTIFERVAFVEDDGKVLLEVDANGEVETAHATPRRPAQVGVIEVESRPAGNNLVYSAPVLHKQKTVGYVVAEIAVAGVLQALLAESSPHGSHAAHHNALVGTDDKVIVASSDFDWTDWRSQAGGFGSMLVTEPVANGLFLLVSFTEADVLQGILTSPFFLGALALVSVPLLFGVAHLLRLSNHNLMLLARFQATRQQRMILRKQNERLQREIDKRFESEKKLAHQANYDQLTGLPNRSLALDRLAQAIKWARREGGSVQVLFLDLDRFKQVNDSLGHAAGDELLREAAQRLRGKMRDSDTVSRLGGDEFLVICPETPGSANWEHCARDLLKTLSLPFYIGDHEFFVGASIGVASFPDGGTEPQRLLKNADIAMYAAKDKGRNRYCFYDPSMDAAAVDAMRLENNLRHALARSEMHLQFQPIVDLSSGRAVAAEALLRWSSSELGDIPPDRFIPVAEETGMIHEIGEWVLMEACRQVGAMNVDRDFRVAVNLSTKQFSRPARLLDCVLAALRASGLMPSQLELEITESVLIDDRPEISDFIKQLDRIGVRLSIDDFGTGYSALNYLQRFPFDTLKIDRSFTREINDSEASSSLIRAIIAMAHALGLEVIAEGIEHRSQAGFLLVQHCEFGQGYLYSRPVTAAALNDYLLGNEAKTA
ncbi:MAG: EAL domain-containing protein [Chromatiaceae bacterium]|nr:EAL domain-containing protein [Chromatiaceae bacterium]MCP5422550.1 EAL domain-containing protein [Chromatiaceae bacterium]